jgi:hypothetical protein
MDGKNYEPTSNTYHYMLFIFDLNKGKKIIVDLADIMVGISKSEIIKYYNIDKNNIVVHFNTDVRYDLLLRTIKKITNDTYRYMLMPFDELVTLGIEEENAFDFVTLEDDIPEIDVNMEDYPEDDYDLEEIKTSLSALLHQSQPKSKLSLDEILDKINQNGVNSLTKEEFDYLNNF